MDKESFKRLEKVEMNFDGYRYRDRGGGIRRKSKMSIMKRIFFITIYL